MACAFSSIVCGRAVYPKSNSSLMPGRVSLHHRPGLRKWYSHDPARFAEFRRRYKAELAERREQLNALHAMVKGRAATLVTATRELDLSHAEVMRSILQRKRTTR
jgi:uncharacterized protein YeaO (DUF488 family)